MADLFSASYGVGVDANLASVLMAKRESVMQSLDQSTVQMFDSMYVAAQEYMPYATVEQIERTQSLINGVTDSWQIVYGRDIFDLQTANEITARTLLTMRGIETMHRLGQIEAWGMEYKPIENELLRRRIQHGTGGLNGKDHVVRWWADNHEMEHYENMTQFQRMTVIKNNNLALASIYEDDDFSSCMSGSF